MKSKVLLALSFLMSAMGAVAQKDNVGIGTTKPDQSAVLDISSNNKGLLTPRMSLQQRNGIQNPAQGLIVYQTDMLSGFYFYDGKEWKTMTSQANANSVADAFNWGLTGNSGTMPGTNFIGTTDNAALRFKVNNVNSGVIHPTNGNTYLGYETGGAGTAGTFNTAFGKTAFVSNTTGELNAAFGVFSLQNNTIGSMNLAIGTQALLSNTSGSGNMAIGTNALVSNNVGTDNVAIGTNSLREITSGYTNVGLGTEALSTVTTGIGNIAIGYRAGKNASGSSNTFIGSEAGLNAVGNYKLYISNNPSNNPLIYGEFDNSILKFNVGATNTATRGFLAIGDFAAATPMITVGGYRLIVQDGILTEKIKVAVKNTSDWADYVFEPSYKIMSLEQVESFVKINKHLPNVASAEEMAQNGLDVMKTNSKLLEKIEELTLYMIEMNKTINALKIENQEIRKSLK
jgi:hypothetical protein